MNNENNICRFILTHKNYGELNILHFVLETKPQSDKSFITVSNYRMCFVTEGKGTLYMQSGTCELETGDIFLIFPAVPFALSSTENLK